MLLSLSFLLTRLLLNEDVSNAGLILNGTVSNL